MYLCLGAVHCIPLLGARVSRKNMLLIVAHHSLLIPHFAGRLSCFSLQKLGCPTCDCDLYSIMGLSVKCDKKLSLTFFQLGAGVAGRGFDAAGEMGIQAGSGNTDRTRFISAGTASAAVSAATDPLPLIFIHFSRISHFLQQE